MKRFKFFAVISFLVLAASLSASAIAQDAPKITKDELKAMMGNDDLVIIDLRQKAHWERSDSKIKGAVREDPGNIASWADKYEKDKTYVLYCA